MSGELINSITLAYSDEAGGLSSGEAGELLEKYGPNQLPEKPAPSDLAIFLSQLKSPLVYILLVAAVITFFIGEFADSIIIGFAVFLNTVLGYFQERRAGHALEALKKLIHPTTEVVRDGKIQKVGAETIVPGDIVILTQGDKIPADGRLIEANRFFVTEAILTGESEPISKEEDSEVFMGTIVTSGRGKMLVVVTGQGTEMGKIATGIIEDGTETPLSKQLRRFSQQLSILVLGLTVVVFIEGVATGGHLAEVFTTSVALAVSAIPEGLLVGLTVVLAIGMQRILARKGLVRNLVSAETLGGVTTICVDKTGTLTQGKMQVVNVIGSEQEIAEHTLLANDLDTSVVVAAWEWGNAKISKVGLEDIKKFASVDSIPFSSEDKFFVSLNKWRDRARMVFVTGAPEILLHQSALSEEEKVSVYKDIERFSAEGKRLLGFARKVVPATTVSVEKESAVSELEWTGMLAFNDPVREDVADALKRTMGAGIKIMVITGDYANTAISVLKELNIEVADKDVVTGDVLEKMSGKELERKIFSGSRDDVKLFARTKPEQKLKIVEILKMHGEVVAMMGDGVNDAPALSRSDIGVVVGDATDVAKESADLVLLDSSFSTIVAAIEEGRGIFDNIRKIILYLMSDAFVEIIVIMSALIVGLPMPLTAVQILWVNLASDGLPHLALTVDPKTPNIMAQGPRSPKEPLVTRWMVEMIAMVSVIGSMFALAAFWYIWKTTGNVVLARSVTFATVGVNSLVYVFAVKTLRSPSWKESIFNNKWLLGAVAGGFMFQLFPFSTPQTREFFSIQAINGYWWVAILGSILLFFVVVSSRWYFWHRK